ncbi:DNA primase [Candidatus Pacearchaeota archaeon]|nr:DNA primase [Candidatus Pacearchaeota archaeon]
MAKISPVSIKYMIHASFKAEGHLEKPDVIGAIFGQTEGLLGSELEMRELQKEGKIGRIEVSLEAVDGKTLGDIEVPTALDKSETTIIAAALETIDRIGPTEALIQITKIEDVRGSKRDFIINRAKKLLESLETKGELEEFTKTLKEESRAEKIQEYGNEKLPAGDLSGNEVIVVEGRADVVNLLKNRVNNVIGMNGTKLPAEISKLGESKELVLFIDGDRGGKLIAKNVISNAKIEWVAVAPDGKEVEELTGKEILISLRKRLPAKEFLSRIGNVNGYSFNEKEKESSSKIDEQSMPGDVKESLRKVYESIKGSKDSLILDKNNEIIRRISSKEINRAILGAVKEISAVIIDGTATSGIIKLCDEKGISYLAALNFTSVPDAKVKLISL